ncbi:MAG TPA: RNA polymerase sigma factor [Pyrinomonadaceae bacterium]|nr:RNA polymerase sigma factor [Pyrinomonadaceae bacterium]
MSAPTTMRSDEELLRLTLAGDERAFTDLYRRRQAGIFRFALQMCGSESVAEDVVQEVFMALIREGRRFDPARGTLSSYLYGVARNQVLRRLERDRHFVASLDADEGREAADDAHDARPDPLSELARAETVASVRQAVLALPAHYREVIVLCELQEMSYAEAAGALGCAVGTVRSRLHRARALLTDKLAEQRARGGEERPARESFSGARCFA